MKKSKFTDSQIVFSLRQAEEGTAIEEDCRKTGMAALGQNRKSSVGLGMSPVGGKADENRAEADIIRHRSPCALAPICRADALAGKGPPITPHAAAGVPNCRQRVQEAYLRAGGYSPTCLSQDEHQRRAQARRGFLWRATAFCVILHATSGPE